MMPIGPIKDLDIGGGREPAFRPGDRVMIRHGGRGHVWTVTGSEVRRSGRIYALDDGRRQRTAEESALIMDGGKGGM